jgi:hypothetical protein
MKRVAVAFAIFALVSVLPAAGWGVVNSNGAAAQVRAVYRSVLLAEYFGPASAVCSRLTTAGRKAFAYSGTGTCASAFTAQQRVLRHKTPGVDDSGFSTAAWRAVVASVMAHLVVSVDGSRATAIGGQSGIPGQTVLVKIGGRWEFNTYPPSIEP